MRREISNRRGSALLIVLGMMSFIVVSAVAFSAYMRYARLPSSYLRRTSSSRLLAKAAVAQAIEVIDCAIGNNPYPGVGDKSYAYPRGEESRGEITRRNYWRDRVFIGDERTVSTDNTVSTLTLEGLAYIPPPYVNEVRHWSRRSVAAEWKTMAFDAGRYAFTAVNVSDCFDVNRMIAEAGRDSSDEGRVNLAHCFENVSHTDYEVDPKKWDNFMSDYRDKSHAKVPLVSVADLNLALHDQKPGGIESPFAQYLEQGANAKFVKDNTPGDPDVELLKNMAFVTDSYYPVTNRNANAIDLTRERDQPLYGFTAGKATSDRQNANEDDIDDLTDGASNNFLKRHAGNFRAPELVQLYDYLDRDSVPLSVALPTAERTAMVTGLGASGKIAVAIRRDAPVEIEDPSAVKDPSTGNPMTKLRVTTAELSVDCSEFELRAGFVFPFKYKRGTMPKFKAQAAATVTFVEAGKENSLRIASAKAPAVVTQKEWSNSQRNPTAVRFGNEATPVVITMMSELKDIRTIPSGGVKTEEEAVLEDLSFDFNGGPVALGSDFPAPGIPGIALGDNVKKAGTFRIIERIPAMAGAGTAATVIDRTLNIRAATVSLDGVVNEEAMTQKQFVPVVQAWVRILDQNNKLVDLVPACPDDDEHPSEWVVDEYAQSSRRPVLRFRGTMAGDGFRLNGNVEDMMNADPAEITFNREAYLADDPRFNYAPENLKYVDNLGGTFKSVWLNEQRSQDRDGDIFMMTSDAGYLQSVYEFAALVDVTGSLRGEKRTDAVNGGHFNGERRTSFGATAADRAMWRTYTQYPCDGRRNEIAPLDIINGTRGMRINPYTDDVNVMMAALANTPLDWWAASTNFVNDAARQSGWKTKNSLADRDVIDLDKASEYSFGDSSEQAKIKHGKLDQNGKAMSGTLLEVAEKLKGQMRGSNGNWETAYDNFGWDITSDEKTLGGVNLGVPLHSVDRKFLHGFWRECFANRQQLFLIFVRAEPMMMGGGGMGQTPPQLGARAVALVWRDPTPTAEDNNGQPRPHRTRLLFYRQFD